MSTERSSAIVVPDARMPFASTARSQATTIEQTRAAAEVHGAIMVAQRCPRDKPRAIAEMEESCRIAALAERAFFRFPRGGQTISGPSVHLARELARCWGNLDYGVKELARDDDGGQSEMLAFAWDLETNTRSETTFIVPHKRDKKGGAEPLTDMRDIYENNANNGARRLRECIFAILPPWFTETAKDICAETLRNGGGKPRDQRLAGCVKAFGAIGINRERLERKIGAPIDKWTDVDIANLGVVIKSIQRGEVSKDDEFPPVESAPPGVGTKQATRLDALEEAIACGGDDDVNGGAERATRPLESGGGSHGASAAPDHVGAEFNLPPAPESALRLPNGEILPADQAGLAQFKDGWLAHIDRIDLEPAAALAVLEQAVAAAKELFAAKPKTVAWLNEFAAQCRSKVASVQ